MKFSNTNNLAVCRQLAVVLALGLPVAPLYAEISDFGITGLIDMPSARMQQDSAFTTVYSRQDVVDLFSLNYQALPWLEASFRYAIQDPRLERGDGDGLRDRSFGVKVRLLNETAYLPDVSVGIQDLFGTEVYGAEYLVATKQLTDNFTATAGLGWGRLSGRDIGSNFLTDIGFQESPRHFGGDVTDGGRLKASSLFSGSRVGLFGGVQYRFNDKLEFVAEYNADSYDRETRHNSVAVKSPYSVGVNWKPNSGTEIGVSWQHGSQLGLRFASTVLSNQKHRHSANKIPGYRLGVRTNRARAMAAKTWYRKLAIDLRTMGLPLRAAKYSTAQRLATVEIQNNSYTLMAEAFRDVANSAFQYLPTEAEAVQIQVYEAGNYPISVIVPRATMQNTGKRSIQSLHREIKILPGNRLQNPDYRASAHVGHLSFTANIGNIISLFDPDHPFIYQVFVDVGASLRLWHGANLNVGYTFDVDNNLDDSTRGSDSRLPRVQSETIKYLQEGKNRLSSLYIDKYGKLGQQTYYRAFGGLLEWRWGGIGTELLHQPHRSRFAYGLSAAAVRQREFKQGFGFRKYSTVTAHASLFWATPFYNYDVAVHAGRYLAKDVGATFELSRRFSNGWQVGVFATFTDVSFEEFGEGSFDKGFIISIPLEQILPARSRRKYSTVIRPITRDGGARLDGYSATLFNKLRAANYDSLYDNLEVFTQ